MAGLHRLSKKALKASSTLCGAAGSGLVWAYRGAVLKTRWPWWLCAYLVMLSSSVAVPAGVLVPVGVFQPKLAAARRPSAS